MEAISLDLRKLVIADCDAGMKTGKVAAKYASSPESVGRFQLNRWFRPISAAFSVF